MSSINKKKLLNEAYDAILIMAGAVEVSMTAKKLAGMPLNTPEILKGTSHKTTTSLNCLHDSLSNYL